MVRLGFIIGLLAIIGGLLSGLAAHRVYVQEQAIDRIALSRAIDIHASLVQDRLTERELLGRVASGLFRTPSVLRADMLEPLRSAIYAFKTDFVSAGWVLRLRPDEIANAEAVLRDAGFADATIRNYQGTPVLPDANTPPLNILMDVEPRIDSTAALLGRSLTDHPQLGPTLGRALRERKPVASDPFELRHRNNAVGFVLAAPVQQSGTDVPIGFVTFSYELAPLMLANDDKALFSVALQDPRATNRELVADDRGVVSQRVASVDTPPSVLRTERFGGRDWILAYYPKTSSLARAQNTAILAAAIGIVLTMLICGLFGYISYNNLRLRREIEVRIGFERRLTAVIDELNHRVKNILAVIQSIVTRTLRHGSDVDVGRELLIGRIHAMSNVVSLLTDSQWQGVKLKGLLDSRAVPHAARIAVNGPDIMVSARAAQSLALLFFELASHADTASEAGPPSVVAQWTVQGSGDHAQFHFRWEEFNSTAATRREDSEFGLILLDRVVPEALGGIAKRYFTDASYVYEIVAPLATVVDQGERDRTGKIAAPIQPRH